VLYGLLKLKSEDYLGGLNYCQQVREKERERERELDREKEGVRVRGIC
jgi:hypothetical protein